MVLIAVIIARCTSAVVTLTIVVLIFVLIVEIMTPSGWTVHVDVGRGSGSG